MNDPHDPQTESQIRRALSARAEEIHVSPDALDNIRSRRPASPWARPAAYAAVAAIVVVFLVGVALLTNPGDDGAHIDDLANDTTLPPETTAPTTTAAPSTTSSTLPPSGPLPTALGEPLQIDPARTFGLWNNPDGLPAADAVEAFVAERFGLTDVDISPTTVDLADAVPSDGVEAFGVHRRGEGGSTLDSFAFKVITHTPPDGASRISLVLSDEFEIYEAVGVAGGIRVTGQGRAFEGTAILEAQGTETLLAVGSGEFADFDAVAPLGEHCPCVVTITGTTAFTGEVPDIISYSINPTFEPAPPEPAEPTYSVFGVDDDDVLNVRSGAGVSNPIITTFPPDATGIVITGEEEMVGAARWSEVETEDARGWVNSQFLVANPDVSSTPGLEDRLLGYLEALPAPQPAFFASSVEFGGIGVYADFPTPWTTVRRDEFDSDRNWSPVGTEDRCPGCTATVEEFLGFDTAKWELAEYTIGSDLDPGDPNHFFQSGLAPEFHDRFVTGTIYIPEPNPQESLDWRRYTVVFDFVADGEPVIRGIWRWGWTP